MNIIQKKNNKHIYHYKIHQDVIELFNEFKVYLDSLNMDFGALTRFINAFLSNRIPLNKNDFNDKTIKVDSMLFNKDFLYEGKPLRNDAKQYLKHLYVFLIENNYGNFEKIDKNILGFHNIFSRINEGYLITYNPNEDELKNNEKYLIIDDNNFYSLDFNAIKYVPFRMILKQFYFEYKAMKFATKVQNTRYYIRFLNFIPEKLPINFTNEIVYQYKNYINSFSKSTQSLFVEVSSVRGLIDYLKLRKMIITNKATEDILKLKNVNSKGKSDYYTAEEIGMILAYLNDKSNNTENENIRDYYRLLTIILLYVLNTSMRYETVIGLKTNDLIESMPGTYYYQTNSKTKEIEKYNITKNIKKLHDEVINITEKYRNINPNISDYLFIHTKFRRSKLVTTFTRPTTISTLKLICNDLNINYYGVGGIRNRFMNKVTKELNSGGDKNLLQSISRHSKQIHYSNYYKNNTEEIVMQLYGVEIGNKPLNGFVKEKIDNEIIENIVMNGRGNCSAKKCENSSNLDCLMCRHFVCTPANIPYFENEINDIDKKIKEAEILHEKEFLVAKKALNVKYLVECMKLKV